MTDEKQWYTNKDLYKMFSELQLSLLQLKAELQNTQTAVRKYNGLREELAVTKRRVDAWEARNSGKAIVAEGVRSWGGWIIAILSFLWTLYKTTRG